MIVIVIDIYSRQINRIEKKRKEKVNTILYYTIRTKPSPDLQGRTGITMRTRTRMRTRIEDKRLESSLDERD